MPEPDDGDLEQDYRSGWTAWRRARAEHEGHEQVDCPICGWVDIGDDTGACDHCGYSRR